MEVVYRLGHATAAQIHAQLDDAPHPAAVRTFLRILEGKRQLRHVKEGARHVYFSTMPREVARKSAVRHLLGTFFNGSRSAAVAALLDDAERPLSPSEREEIETVIQRLRARGR